MGKKLFGKLERNFRRVPKNFEDNLKGCACHGEFGAELQIYHNDKKQIFESARRDDNISALIFLI